MFTLKVYHGWGRDHFYSNSDHECGGIDVLQNKCFHHLFPSGVCHDEGLLCDMVEAHGWKLNITGVNITPDGKIVVVVEKE